MSEKKSVLDEFRQNLSMAQQIANKPGYETLVNYMGSDEVNESLVLCNVAEQFGMQVTKSKYFVWYKAYLIEKAKAYAVAHRLGEISYLGLWLGDTKRRYKNKRRKSL